MNEAGGATSELAVALEDVCEGRLPLRAHFQPIVDLRRGTVTGYEALARFPAEVGLAPDRAFALADELGLGPALERRAIGTILAHRHQLGENRFLSLNLGPEAACDAQVLELLAAEGDLRGLVLEITEQAPVEDYPALIGCLAELRAQGAAVAVDDAGAGYSSMRHIVALEPQFVKLDRSLITGVDSDPRKAAAITAIGTFAGELDAWVVAEGIETGGELSALAALELPLAQGFLLGRPAESMQPVDPGLQGMLLERSQHRGSGIGALMQIAATVHPGDRDEDAFTDLPTAELAVRVDEHRRPVGLLIRRGETLHEAPVLCAEAGEPAAKLALRAMARPSGLRFLPVACCDGRGRLLGVVPIERLVESLARP